MSLNPATAAPKVFNCSLKHQDFAFCMFDISGLHSLDNDDILQLTQLQLHLFHLSFHPLSSPVGLQYHRIDTCKEQQCLDTNGNEVCVGHLRVLVQSSIDKP